MWKETIGTIYSRSSNFKSSVIHYNVDGKNHEKTISGWYVNVVMGEKYAMRYDPDDPDNIQIDMWHPIFEANEAPRYHTGKILDIEKRTFFNTVPTIDYMFKANGRNIKKWVYLPDNYQQLYPKLDVGQLYNVQVWDSDINRAVLRLDLPIRIIEKKK